MQDFKSFIKLNLHEDIPWVFITKKLRVGCHVNFKSCLLKFRVLTILTNDTENKRFEEMLALKTDMDDDQDETAKDFPEQWQILRKRLCQACADQIDKDGYFLGFEDYAKWVNEGREKVGTCCKHKMPALPYESFKEDYFKSIEEIQMAFTKREEEEGGEKGEDYFFAMQIWSEEKLSYVIDMYTQCKKKDDPFICFLYGNF